MPQWTCLPSNILKPINYIKKALEIAVETLNLIANTAIL